MKPFHSDHRSAFDATSNGLSYLISRFIDEENFCYLNLEMSARSRLAEQAAELL